MLLLPWRRDYDALCIALVCMGALVLVCDNAGQLEHTWKVFLCVLSDSALFALNDQCQSEILNFAPHAYQVYIRITDQFRFFFFFGVIQ